MLYEHNIPVYEQFAGMLDEFNEVFLITATGTGKSYVTLEYITTHNLKALIVTPRTVLNREWRNLYKDVDTITYQSFCKCYEDFYEGYDMIVFDEAHHIGSPVWGGVARAYKNNRPAHIKVAALTADPHRYSDKDRNVAKEMFPDTTVFGYDRDEAIRLGILPNPTYVKAVFDQGSRKFGEDDTLTVDSTWARIDYDRNNIAAGIIEILYKHMPEGSRKGIIFVDRISTMPTIIKIMELAYPDEAFKPVHSKLDKKDADKVINWFRSTKHGYIVTVDMFNEGVHIPGINTLMMMRRTSSPAVYTQQLGRALGTDNSDVFVFDFVGNFAQLRVPDSVTRDSHGNVIQEVEIEAPDLRPRIGLEKLSDQDIVDDIVSNVENVSAAVTASIDAQRWTAEADVLMWENYPQIGALGMQKQYFPQKSTGAIRRRAWLLGIDAVMRRVNRRWTHKEDMLLIRHYNDKGSAWCAAHLPGRTVLAVRGRARYLRVCDLTGI